MYVYIIVSFENECCRQTTSGNRSPDYSKSPNIVIVYLSCIFDIIIIIIQSEPSSRLSVELSEPLSSPDSYIS
jgi:hypothetical protein